MSTADVAATAAGPDPRRTIVFLHGARLTGAAWSVQVAALADSFHCLTPDLAGHGVAAEVPFTIAGAANAIADLIERDGHDGRAILVGLSLGGYVAMAVAAGWPERVAGLVVSGSTAEPVGVRSLAYRSLAGLFAPRARPLVLRLNRWFFRRRYGPSVADPILADGFWFDGGAVALRSLVGERFRPRLAAYQGPTLLINGQYDVFFRPAEASFARVAPNARRITIGRATHLANLDQPERFTTAIRDFAMSLPARPD